jgi:hypothetical protein
MPKNNNDNEKRIKAVEEALSKEWSKQLFMEQKNEQLEKRVKGLEELQKGAQRIIGGILFVAGIASISITTYASYTVTSQATNIITIPPLWPLFGFIFGVLAITFGAILLF